MWSKFIILLMLPLVSRGENINCKNIHEGTFKSHDLFGSLNTIIRTNDKQTETWGRSSKVLEYDIHWTSECTFYLYNQKVVKGSDSLLTVTDQDTLYNEIIEVNKYWHNIISSVNGCEPKVEKSYFNVDTTTLYRDLNEVDKFNEYKGTSSGGTFVGYNYAVTYKQHSTEMNKYAITFLEALIVNEKSKFKVLDNFYCTVDTNQKITITNCRFNDEYDNEIVAIYNSAKSDSEATIIQAWRFNKLSLKIEEVETQMVKYKEVDKRLPIWIE